MFNGDLRLNLLGAEVDPDDNYAEWLAQEERRHQEQLKAEEKARSENLKESVTE